MDILINFADEGYRKAQKLNTWSGKYLAKFDNVLEYGPNDIDEIFKKENKEIFEHERGNGLWIWKPYFILKTLSKLNEGDHLFYSDSGTFFIRNINHIKKVMDESDIWVSKLPLVEKQFTKIDSFILMNCEHDAYKDTNQISGTFIMLRKSEKSIQFVKEWLNYCKDIRILGPQENVMGKLNDSSFIAHREDQSVLSLLSKKWSLKIYNDPSQYGKLPEKYKSEGRIFLPSKSVSEYPVVIIHHRTPNANIKVCVKQLMCGILPRSLSKKIIRVQF